MKDRFTGDAGRRILLQTLKEQKIIAGNLELAEQIALTGELVDVKPGAAIIEQGNNDNDVYLIVAGSFDIVVNGRTIDHAKQEGYGVGFSGAARVRAQFQARQEGALEWRIRRANLPERWSLETFPFRPSAGRESQTRPRTHSTRCTPHWRIVPRGSCATNLVYNEWPNFLGNRPMMEALLSRLSK